MPHALTFEILPQAPSSKVLQTWRKDAGWKAPVQANTLKHPNAIIHWARVMAGKHQAGIVRLELAPPEFCYVGDLIIASKFRGEGIGSWFLLAIEQYAGNLGIKRLVLQPEAGTEGFYAARQFVSDPFVPSFLKKDLSPLQRKRFLQRPA
jgi:GNAT superfamily N-acetyltransferase